MKDSLIIIKYLIPKKENLIFRVGGYKREFFIETGLSENLCSNN